MLKRCETTSPPLKQLIEKYFIPWFGNRYAAPDHLFYNTDWFRFASGLGTFSFPLICVLDPNDNIAWDSKAYLDRTAGLQDAQVLYDRLLKFTQDSSTTCDFTISPTSALFDSSANHTPFGDAGNNGTVEVKTSASNCSWTAKSNASWITITAGSSGAGDGKVIYSVADNATGSARTGTLTIGGQTFTVTQNGATTCDGATSISPASALFNSSANHTPFGDVGNKGTVEVKTSGSSCSWTATSNALWITISAGSSGTGGGTVTYSVADNPTGTRTGTLTIGGQTFTVTQNGATTQNNANTDLYFPHVETSLPWQTEIAIINTGDQTVTGALKAFSNDGQLLETKEVTLNARGRRQISVASEFTNHADTGYIIFDTDSPAVQGYTKFYMKGIYGAAIPAVKEVNTSDIYISHIDSSDQWWTGLSLVNTNPETKELTIAFNNGESRNITLNANEHRAFNIEELFDNQPQPDIHSAVIVAADGIVGLELFGSADGTNQLEGIPLTDKTASTLYYPQVDNDGWWTGVAAYNPSDLPCTITITPYDTEGAPFTPTTLSIEGKDKYIGSVAELGFPAKTAWFRIDSTGPLTGFELFGTGDGNQLAAYTGGVGTGAKEGVFPKIEKNGWTGITFVNTEDVAATVSLRAYNDNGSVVATSVLTVGGYSRVIKLAEALFTQDISSATYIAYSSDANIVGFQLNGSADGMMLDGLPGL